VADASVLPTVGRGQPNATSIALGEKAADLITGKVRIPHLIAAL
jgi:choline dehydrogenase